MRVFRSFFLSVGAALLLGIGTAHAAESYGLALHGDLKYGPKFDHFAYVNKDASKGGTLRLGDLGTFDSLNPFILKGTPAPGLNAMGQGLIYESLMTQAEDEPFSMYGLIAQSVDLASDRSAVTFTINPAAHWSDGTPITAGDVVWTFDTLMKVGNPFFKAYFAEVGKATADSSSQVTFTLKNPKNRELPLIVAQMVILPKHFWTQAGRNIGETSLTPPLGSGPYKIGALKPGASIEYVRDPNWWGKDLPANRGRFNFDRITFDEYRDQNVLLEAFFAGQFDVHQENVAKLWATAYTAPAIKDGRITKAEIPHSNPVGMQGFIFNLRRPVFSDIRVREALSLAFDYEWANKQLAFGAYTRTDSFFENSDLASAGTPDAAETALLDPFRSQLPPELFSTPFTVPATDGSGNNRSNLRRAAQLLDEAGYKLGPDGIRTNEKGQRLSFEFLDSNPALERWISPFLQNLKKIGVAGTLRIIDPAQYQNRMNSFDFDMTTMVIGQSDSPGNEQVDYWTSAKAKTPGSRNYMGIESPVVDALVAKILAAQTREELVTATRALDRVLLWQNALIPGWHYPKWRVAWWNTLAHPEGVNSKSLGITDTWWSKKTAP